MLTQMDCLAMLTRMSDAGIAGADAYIRKALLSKEPPLDALRFILEHRGLHVADFYEMLRKSHNKKGSPLYTNLLSDSLPDDELPTTLSSLLTQIFLFGRKLPEDERYEFYQAARAPEVAKAVEVLSADEDKSAGLAVLGLIRSDLLVLEYLAGKRELA